MSRSTSTLLPRTSTRLESSVQRATPEIHSATTPISPLRTSKSFIQCSCNETISQTNASEMTRRCPLHNVEYIYSLPVDRIKLASIPAESAIKSLPPFLIGDKVYLFGGLPLKVQMPHSDTMDEEAQCEKCAVTIADDSKYHTDGTFSIETVDGTVHHGISGLRLEPIIATSVTPRYMNTFVEKMGRAGTSMNPQDLSLHKPHSMSEEKIDELLQKYTKLVRLNYETSRNMAVILSRRATLYATLGHFKESLQDAERAISLEPTFTTAYFRKGYALCCLHRYADACVEFRKGLEHDTSCPHLRHALEITMNTLHQNPMSQFSRPAFTIERGI